MNRHGDSHNAPLTAALNAERGKVKNEQFFISTPQLFLSFQLLYPTILLTARQQEQKDNMIDSCLPDLHMTLCFLLPVLLLSGPHTLGDTWLKKHWPYTGRTLPRITCPQQCGTFLNRFNLLLCRHRATHLFYCGFHHTWVAGDTC